MTMRTQFVQYADRTLNGPDCLGAESEDEVYRLYPWAAKVFEVDGGFWAFESSKDAMAWRRQQSHRSR